MQDRELLHFRRRIEAHRPIPLTLFMGMDFEPRTQAHGSYRQIRMRLIELSE